MDGLPAIAENDDLQKRSSTGRHDDDDDECVCIII